MKVKQGRTLELRFPTDDVRMPGNVRCFPRGHDQSATGSVFFFAFASGSSYNDRLEFTDRRLGKGILLPTSYEGVSESKDWRPSLSNRCSGNRR